MAVLRKASPGAALVGTGCLMRQESIYMPTHGLGSMAHLMGSHSNIGYYEATVENNCLRALILSP